MLVTIALPQPGIITNLPKGRGESYHLPLKKLRYTPLDKDPLKTKHSLGKPLLPVMPLRTGYWAKNIIPINETEHYKTHVKKP